MNIPNSKLYPAEVIAIAAGVSARTIHRLAVRQGWKRGANGNEFGYLPPRALLVKCRRLMRRVPPRGGLQLSGLTAARRAEALRIVHRLFCCLLLVSALDAGEAREAALIRVAQLGSFACSPRSLRRWTARLEKLGVSGLAENKRGRVGAKPGGQSRE